MMDKRHDMHSMEMPHGTPWLETLIVLHSSREYTCEFNETWRCEYQQGYWRFWYELDHRYALPTVAFFMAVILLFALGNLFNQVLSRRISESVPLRRILALNRYLSYRSFRIPLLDWNSAPLGVLLLGVVGAIYFLCMTLAPKPYYWDNERDPDGINWGNSPPIAARSGWLSLACMPFVFATAGKSNFITALTGVSHEKLQVFHRWIAYAFFVTALVHTFPFIVYHVWYGDMVEQWMTSVFYWTGVVALLAQTWLTFASMSPLRNWCYEWFKFSHFVAGLVFMVFFFLHCGGSLTSWDYFIATGALFSLSWLHRQLRIYFEHGIRHQATLYLESNGFIRVSVPMKSPWRAGQHYFVRFLTLGFHSWTLHPFSACSLPQRTSMLETKASELVFYIRPRTGFTARLARYVEAHNGCKMRVMLDGPNGGVDMQKVEGSQRMVLVAGGSGAGWMLPLIQAHFRKLELVGSGMLESRPTMRVILATRDMATVRWFEEAVVNLLESFGSDHKVVDMGVEIFYTGTNENANAPKTTGQFLQKLDEPEKADASDVRPLDSQSDSDHSTQHATKSQHIDGRPDLTSIIAAEAVSATSSVGVFLCGPLSMQSDVANAVARSQVGVMKRDSGEIYLHMEHFSWA